MIRFLGVNRLENRTPLAEMLAIEALIVGVGSVVLFSVSWYFAQAVFGDPFRIWRRQMIWVLLGIGAGWVVYRTPRWLIQRSIPVLVWISLFLNILTYIPGVGYSSGGASRWIEIFGFTFQPSELTRVAIILYLSRMLDKKEGRLSDFMNSLLPLLLVIGSLVVTVYFQNDFSTAAFLLILTLAMLCAAGISWVSIASALGGIAVVSAGMLMARPYRVERVKAWFQPMDDPSGSGYQLIQAWKALERGGFWGVGLGRGESKFGRLPDAHSDFVVAVIGEEMGFVGVLAILILFTLFAFFGWRVAMRAPDNFSRWAILGLVLSIYWQIQVNFAVVSGLLPATGIPLPLFSAGGTAAFVTLIMFGLIFNLASRRV